MRPPSFLCCAGCGKLALLKIFGRRHRCHADNNNNNATGRNVSAREPPAEGGGRIRGGQGASEGRDARGGRRRPMGPRTRAKRESNALQRVVGRKRPKGPRPYIQREFLTRA